MNIERIEEKEMPPLRGLLLPDDEDVFRSDKQDLAAALGIRA